MDTSHSIWPMVTLHNLNFTTVILRSSSGVTIIITARDNNNLVVTAAVAAVFSLSDHKGFGIELKWSLE